MLRLGLLVPLLVPLLVLCRRFGRQGRTDHCYDLVVVAVAAAFDAVVGGGKGTPPDDPGVDDLVVVGGFAETPGTGLEDARVSDHPGEIVQKRKVVLGIEFRHEGVAVRVFRGVPRGVPAGLDGAGFRRSRRRRSFCFGSRIVLLPGPPLPRRKGRPGRDPVFLEPRLELPLADPLLVEPGRPQELGDRLRLPLGLGGLFLRDPLFLQVSRAADRVLGNRRVAVAGGLPLGAAGGRLLVPPCHPPHLQLRLELRVVGALLEEAAAQPVGPEVPGVLGVRVGLAAPRGRFREAGDAFLAVFAGLFVAQGRPGVEAGRLEGGVGIGVGGGGQHRVVVVAAAVGGRRRGGCREKFRRLLRHLVASLENVPIPALLVADPLPEVGVEVGLALGRGAVLLGEIVFVVPVVVAVAAVVAVAGLAPGTVRRVAGAEEVRRGSVLESGGGWHGCFVCVCVCVRIRVACLVWFW
mmetsp:Transcript_30365/g.63632  ORF Transcript_30365/g.63632 Transcript_30365/m.63632 type:complete len:465 (+) Transcript_30365:1349-2743(+)